MPRRERRCLLLGENPQHVVFAQDDVLRAVDLHIGPAVLADEDTVALLHFHGDALAFLGHAAGADGDDLALLRLLLGGVRNDDPASLHLLLLDSTNQDPVGERPDVHSSPPRMAPWWARESVSWRQSECP